MDRLNPPETLQLQGNVAENFKKFKQSFEIFQVASGLESKAKKIQSMTLLHVVGSDALEIYNTFRWAEGDCAGECEENLHTTECILKKFENYCTPRKNVTIERHVFFSRNQAAGETFDQYVTDLKLKAKTCEFQTLTDILIKDRIVLRHKR